MSSAAIQHYKQKIKALDAKIKKLRIEISQCEDAKYASVMEAELQVGRLVYCVIFMLFLIAF
jgi:prefoldin subunit 5